MVSLGHIPGGHAGPYSYAADVSADGSLVVGLDELVGAVEAFRWTATGGMQSLGDLPGGERFSAALGVTSDGSMIVGTSASGRGLEAFVFTDGMLALGDLPGGAFVSIANDISADGAVIVGRGNSARGDEAFIWSPDTGMRSLRQVLIDEYGANMPGWQLVEARRVSPDGTTIVGYGVNPQGQLEGGGAVIPEPATCWALVLGAGLLRRRRTLDRARAA